MPVEIALNSPLAEALNSVIQPKLVEVGWASGGGDDSALSEYIILMLVNGKTQDEIAAELSGDLLNLGSDDPGARDFSRWLFEQIDIINAQLNPTDVQGDGMTGVSQDSTTVDGDQDMDMSAANEGQFNAPTGPKAMRNANNNNRGGQGKRIMGQINRAMDRSHDSVLHRQQSEMMAQMQQQLMMQNGMNNGGFNQGRGKPLSDRVQHPHRGNFRRGGHHQNGHGSHSNDTSKAETGAEGDDVEMGGAKREALNPDDAVCKYNLNCTNKDCKFAHQSPAAPAGTTVDVHDVCGFGAACKNRKCVGRHPSPATKAAHQNEQDCKFWPNCQNPRCPFKHPSKPLCRNGGDCSVPGCEFTHTKVMCKFRPCTNRYCTFKHEEGQKGTFQDKVWTADGAKHISERKFTDENAAEDVVIPGAADTEPTGVQEVVG
ncbi:putative nuclear polyadenylated rna-binding protein nab2 protein [Phaeoacremonium minimum UCRPA7]|uniref:Putative nuclear polyadenylated rna-binding protein nab2 protein n=1 Tax=Phaeoacremonium minimum (strain UCR-PA7) TaxID=1286976 RepID=R8BF88_PHAM7|nr:putative nuclear polyadenylated rna-binding protein nab2 protein [Phaeoacremonium minimum UCRPA7]EON97959.1 putative nuclear polyadenylated rna-binding protein nab2 protein [Phaeoacremonium minimum UCRPA7]